MKQTAHIILALVCSAEKKKANILMIHDNTKNKK